MPTGLHPILLPMVSSPRSLKTTAKRREKHKRFPWGATSAVFLSYVLLGWHLAIYAPFWQFFAYFFCGLVAIILIWGTGNVVRLARMGPRSIFTMLVLSSAITLAVVASYIFALLAVIMATDTLLRVEMRSLGYSSGQVLGVLMPVGLAGMALGLALSRVIASDGFWMLSGG